MALEALRTRSFSETSSYEFANLQGLICSNAYRLCGPKDHGQGLRQVSDSHRIPSIYPVGFSASQLVTKMSHIEEQRLGSSLLCLSVGFLSSSLHWSLPCSISSVPGNLTFPTSHPSQGYQSSLCKGQNQILFAPISTAHQCPELCMGHTRLPPRPASSPDSACVCPSAVASDPI